MRGLIFLVLWIILGCTSPDTLPNNAKPQLGTAKKIDLDDDGVDDATILYSEFSWDGVGTSGWGLSVSIRPKEGNLTLHKRDAKLNSHTLFNIIGDTIRKNAMPPQEWDGGAEAASITQAADGKWPGIWSIPSQNPSAPYYVGMKFKKGNDDMVGWIKLDININSGEVTVIDKAFTSSDFIVIDR